MLNIRNEFPSERLLEPRETGTRHLGGECAFSQPGVVTVRRLWVSQFGPINL
jgi:hypothetical protein